MNGPSTYKTIDNPPGGILIWGIVFLELLTFGLALVALAFLANGEPELFHRSRMLLDVKYGTINTVFLLTSGFFMALAVTAYEQRSVLKAKKYLLITLVFGFLFLVIKSIEYSHKIDAGLTIGYNEFFSFYWLLTLFHVVHVLVGMVILVIFYFSMKSENPTIDFDDFEAGAVFWHMCDLIWLLLFPVLYLIF